MAFERRYPVITALWLTTNFLLLPQNYSVLAQQEPPQKILCLHGGGMNPDST